MLPLYERGKASFIIGGQWGSEGKGAAAAWVAASLAKEGRSFSCVTTNAGAQAGHTSIHNGVRRVNNFLPTAALIAMDHGHTPTIYLNAGAIINSALLLDELNKFIPLGYRHNLIIHPNAAIITDKCIELESDPESPQTHISSTRKGVGAALSMKTMRSGVLAKGVYELQPYVMRDFDLNKLLRSRGTILVEVPQGLGLSLDSEFYPYCTSRNCTIGRAMDDAGIHPELYGSTLLVLRTFPIRVGNLEGKSSGGWYDDQSELTWSQVGREPELTTVTKRVRRVFSFSWQQAKEALVQTRPAVILLTFCDYLEDKVAALKMAHKLQETAAELGLSTPMVYGAWGPTTADIKRILANHL